MNQMSNPGNPLKAYLHFASGDQSAGIIGFHLEDEDLEQPRPFTDNSSFHLDVNPDANPQKLIKELSRLVSEFEQYPPDEWAEMLKGDRFSTMEPGKESQIYIHKDDGTTLMERIVRSAKRVFSRNKPHE